MNANRANAAVPTIIERTIDFVLLATIKAIKAAINGKSISQIFPAWAFAIKDEENKSLAINEAKIAGGISDSASSVACESFLPFKTNKGTQRNRRMMPNEMP